MAYVIPRVKAKFIECKITLKISFFRLISFSFPSFKGNDDDGEGSCKVEFENTSTTNHFLLKLSLPVEKDFKFKFISKGENPVSNKECYYIIKPSESKTIKGALF